jgi:DNA topoisomerase VI subunit B
MFLNIIIELIFKLLLQINNASIIRNIPHVHLHEKRENKQLWHGAEIQVVIEGNWTTYRVCNFIKSAANSRYI